MSLTTDERLSLTLLRRNVSAQARGTWLALEVRPESLDADSIGLISWGDALDLRDLIDAAHERRLDEEG